MRRALVLVSLVLFSPAVAFAQTDKKAPAAPTTCEELAHGIDMFEAGENTRIEELADGCRITDFYAGFGPYNRFRIGALTLKSPDIFADLAAERFPSELELDISDLLISPDTGSAFNTYIIEMQAEPMDLHLAYRWDQEARTVELADFSLTTPEYGAMRLTGRISDIDLDPAQLDDLSEIPGSFDHLVFEIDNARFFSVMVGPAIVGLLPYDEDPRPLIEQYQQTATAFIDNLPTDNVSEDSKAALVTLVEAFPRMNGDYRLELRADPGLRFNDLAVDALPQLLPVLSSLQLAVTHTPADQP